MLEQSEPTAVEVAAYKKGQRRGLAIAALAVALIAFLQLLGVEKALLAIVLGVLATRGAAKSEAAHRWGRIAVIIAACDLVAIIVLIVAYHATLIQLFHLLQKLG